MNISNMITSSIRFFFTYIQFKKFLKRNQITKQKTSNTDELICVVIQPWMGTAVPWYGYTLALSLIEHNKSICILIDDLMFSKNELFVYIQIFFIKRITNRLQGIDIILMSNFNSNNTKIDYSIVNKIVNLNSIHYTKGETNTNARDAYKKIILPQYENIYRHYHNFFSNKAIKKIIIPGGFYSSSYIAVTLSKSRDIQVITYDADENYLLFSINGIAAHLSDFYITFNAILNSSDDKLFAIQKGAEKINERRNNKDLMYQVFNQNVIFDLESIGDGYCLMLLNSVWDATTLDMHIVYKNMIDWIIESIKWILNNTNKTIVIRQHPAERHKLAKGNDNYQQLLYDEFGFEPRIVLIIPEDDINTYTLIEKSSFILGFCSTSIVESIALGKPAIIVSNTYYSNCGIVYSAQNKNEYYSLLQQASNHELKVTQEMIERACISNYITQSCNWYKTEFTPHPNNFNNWSQKKMDEFTKNYLPLKAIIDNIPVSYLKHKENLNVQKI